MALVCRQPSTSTSRTCHVWSGVPLMVVWVVGAGTSVTFWKVKKKDSIKWGEVNVCTWHRTVVVAEVGGSIDVDSHRPIRLPALDPCVPAPLNSVRRWYSRSTDALALDHAKPVISLGCCERHVVGVLQQHTTRDTGSLKERPVV